MTTELSNDQARLLRLRAQGLGGGRGQESFAHPSIVPAARSVVDEQEQRGERSGSVRPGASSSTILRPRSSHRRSSRRPAVVPHRSSL